MEKHFNSANIHLLVFLIESIFSSFVNYILLVVCFSFSIFFPNVKLYIFINKHKKFLQDFTRILNIDNAAIFSGILSWGFCFAFSRATKRKRDFWQTMFVTLSGTIKKSKHLYNVRIKGCIYNYEKRGKPPR